MNIFCIDIGNTHTHFGIVENGRAPEPQVVLSRKLNEINGLLEREILHFSKSNEKPAFAFCSVFPDATEMLKSLFQRTGLKTHLFQLTHEVRLNMPIRYPKPAEIGQDRLSNAVAATAFYPLPCIVIDLGTAVTFDIVTESGGYEGGIIAPGVRIMTDYLYEQTALLPRLGDDFAITGAIGQSTAEAMKIGCLIGFGGMVQALLDAVTKQLVDRGEKEPTIVATGGAAKFLQPSLRQRLIDDPGITLRGLANAYALNLNQDSR